MSQLRNCDMFPKAGPIRVGGWTVEGGAAWTSGLLRKAPKSEGSVPPSRRQRALGRFHVLFSFALLVHMRAGA